MSEQRIGTPNNIDVLLHYYITNEPHPRRCAPAVRDSIDMFLRLGVIEPDGENDHHHLTDLGKAWVCALRNVLMPKCAYIDEMGRELEI